MKRFKDFINEGVEEATADTKFLGWLEDVKTAFTKDFKRDSTKEAEAFINQYYDMLRDSFDNGFTVREAIAATKIPGTMVTVAKLDESYVFEIDDDFENSHKTLEGIECKEDLKHGEEVIDNFYHKYYRKGFSDIRIIERLKNNYKSLISVYEQKARGFNESVDQPIKNKDIDEMIDEVLDRLSKKKKLSKSEQKFMEEASKFTINQVTIPQPTGNFWADMGNPHNLGIMWKGKDDVWQQLKSVEDEEDEEMEGKETSDQAWERRKKRKILKYAEELPGLVEILNDLALKVKKYNESTPKRVLNNYNKKLMDLVKDKSSDYKYQFSQKVDYATNGTLYSLFNQFGPLITSIKEYDDDDE